MILLHVKVLAYLHAEVDAEPVTSQSVKDPLCDDNDDD